MRFIAIIAEAPACNPRASLNSWFPLSDRFPLRQPAA
jgi:hypothetical protein